jgi:hypothetical protein
MKRARPGEGGLTSGLMRELQGKSKKKMESVEDEVMRKDDRLASETRAPSEREREREGLWVQLSTSFTSPMNPGQHQSPGTPRSALGERK